MSAMKPKVELFTDGACSGNPGPGGWAYILKHPGSGKVRKDSGGEASTTNNRMELLAVINGLRTLDRPCQVELYSDSQYVVNGLNEWMDDWITRGWRNKKRTPVRNIELWQQLDELRSQHDITCIWVRGHDNHPENEECDAMAVAAIDRVRRRGR